MWMFVFMKVLVSSVVDDVIKYWENGIILKSIF